MQLGFIKITYNRTETHFMDDSFVNLGEEVILTLLWQSGTSESATVCFVISLSICYWLFKCGVLHVVCACVWESESERGERERERERERGSQRSVVCVCVCARVCSCVCSRAWERATRSHNCGLCANTYELHHCVCHSVPLGLELMVKLRTLLTVFTFILKAKAHDYGKGRYISDSCLQCSANHNALCQLANQSRQRLSEGGTL